MKQKYTVFITTSGLGQRLGEITKYTNKALISLGGKTIISHIIDLYPKNTEFIITTGYFGDQVKQYLQLAYPNHDFKFVDIKLFSGPGSSLGYSMLQAEKYLQKPFIFHASDTIISTRPPVPNKNWNAGFKGTNSSQYRSFNIMNLEVQVLKEKGAIVFDFLHIGLVGINDYKKFWKTLGEIYSADKKNTELSDVHVLNKMILDGSTFDIHEAKEWYDTGNVESLTKAKEQYPDLYTILPKLKETIYFQNKNVIKFYFDTETITHRVKRAKILKKVVPKILKSTQNFYMYKKIEGELYADVATPNNFRELLSWSKRNLWKKTNEVSEKKFKEVCYDFYYTKTVSRIHKFFDKQFIKDSENIINDETVPTIKNLLKMMDFDWLCTTEQRLFHGDFILDNILYNKNKFYLLDWRGNFGGLLKSGDMYYDLAKLNHNLTVNHHIVNQNLFTININKKNVQSDILRKDSLVECQKVLFDFIKQEKLDIKKVQVLTGLIWLNMSPLHHHPFDLFLFYFGKLHLWRAIHEKNKTN